MSGSLHVFVTLLGMLSLAPALCAAPPSTRPAEDPRTRELHQWLDKLGDADVRVRQQASEHLMTLDRRELERFRQVVHDNQPLAAEQEASLHEIVTQAYLAGDEYDSEGRTGFLGAKLADRQNTDPAHRFGGVWASWVPAAQGMDEDGDPAAPEDAQRVGILVTERVKGFSGYQMLEDGDVILGIRERPYLRLRTTTDFIAAVQSTPAGRTMRLVVLRAGRVLTVAVKLDPRPEGIRTESEVNQFQFDRLQRAEAFWEKYFLPELKDRVS